MTCEVIIYLLFMALTHKQKIGQIGENVAVKHFVKLGFKILDRNYRKKWGEIDIIAKKSNVLHFIEVKSVSYETSSRTENDIADVSYETLHPEENIHYWKRKRLARAIQSYLMEKNVSCETDWQVDMIAVFLNLRTKKAKIRLTENIML